MPEFNSDLGLEDRSSVKESEVKEAGEVTPSYEEIKQKVFDPYLKWVSERGGVTQFIIILVLPIFVVESFCSL